MKRFVYHRIILKLSGDILKGKKEGGIDFSVVDRITGEIASAHKDGLEVGIVVGGGNLIRGSEAIKTGFDRITADNMGMLSTVINAMALQNALEKLDTETRIMSAISISEVVEPFIRRRAIRHIEKGRVLIFAAGTGNPLFTTDTAAALRATQIKAEIILKGTKVDGVYNNDPVTNANATMFDEIDYMEVLKHDLRVMDLTAITFCRDNKIPIRVFNILKPGNFRRVIEGHTLGTFVKGIQ
ncbi:MAG: UMP kinase [Candidatus Hatepunaea meridiana]|nr:UMP kinase [Candidatus Hatepunaea meridiana]